MRLLLLMVLVGLLAGPGCTGNDDPADAKAASTTDDELPQVFEPDPRAGASLNIGATLEQIELEAKSLMDGKMTVHMPVNMRPMTEQQLELKYPGESRPSIAFTADRTSGAVNLTATHTGEPLKPGQIYEYHFHFENNLKNIPKYKEAEWIDNRELTVDGRPVFLAEFRNQLADYEVYNMILGVSLDDRLLLVTFNFPRALEETWLDTARQVLLGIDFHSETERQSAATNPLN